MALTICSMLSMAGFCALCTIFFTYSGAFVLHLCVALLGGAAALIAVLTHSPCALFLHIIVQVDELFGPKFFFNTPISGIITIYIYI